MITYLPALFKRMITLIILAFFACSLAVAQDTDKEKLDRLTVHLLTIGERAYSSRTLGGGMLIGMGVLIGAGGVIITETVPDMNSDDRLLYDAIFAGTGGLMVVSGVLVLILPSEYETLPGKFKELPEDSPEAIRKKINTGEVYLEKLARTAERDRLISSGTMIALGIAELAFYFFVDPADTDNDNYARDMLLYEGILDCGGGLVSLFVKSSPETEYESYTHWKKSQGISRQENGNAVRFALLPTRQGLVAALRFSF